MKRQFKRVFLVGFMGAGKTTVAQLLAARMGWDVVETDELIVRREGRSIPAIFDWKGESHFRSLENLVLTELTSRYNIVVSPGGGAFIQENNRELMLSSGLVVWIDVPFDVIAKRLEGDKTRPLFDKKAAERYLARLPFYALAHVKVDGSQSVDEVVEQVLRAIS